MEQIEKRKKTMNEREKQLVESMHDAGIKTIPTTGADFHSSVFREQNGDINIFYNADAPNLADVFIKSLKIIVGGVY